MELEIISTSPAQTRKIGEQVGEYLKKGDIVTLYGTLGSGKTTLTQGIAQGLGVTPNQYVRSPSFVLINEYKGKLPVYHIDLYRLMPEEIYQLGSEEYLFGKGVCIIEWAEKMYNLLPENVLSVRLELLTRNNERKLKVEGKGRYLEILKHLKGTRSS